MLSGSSSDLFPFYLILRKQFIPIKDPLDPIESSLNWKDV